MHSIPLLSLYQSQEAKQETVSKNTLIPRIDIFPQEDNNETLSRRYIGSFNMDNTENLSSFSRAKLDQTQEGSNSVVSLKSSSKLEIAQKSIASIIDLEKDMGDQVMQRLNEIIKQRQNLPTRSANKIEKSGEINQGLTPTVQRNMSLVRRISKFRDIKGIKQNSKEMKFEDRLKEFQNVKTFVKIPDVIKKLSDKVNALPDSQLKRSSFRGTKGSLTTPSRFAKHSAEQRLSFDTNLSNEDENESTGTSPRKGSDRFEPKLQQIDEDEIEINEMEEMIQQLKENIIKQIGLEAFEAIEAELLSPKKQKELKSRTKIQMLKLRAMKEKLRNSDVFHSLINYLSPQGADKMPDENGMDNSLKTFYQDIDRKLKFDQESSLRIQGDDLDKEEWEAESPHTEKQNFQLRALLLKQEIARNEELSKQNKVPEIVGNLVEHVDDDRQVRVAGVLNAYKERSDKVIKLLKKKTLTIGQRDLKTDRAVIEDTKYKLNKVFDPFENSSLTQRTSRNHPKILIRHNSKPYLPILTRDESIATTQIKDNWKTTLPDYYETDEKTKSKSSKIPVTEHSPAKYQQNILENKKKFLRLNQQRLMKTNYWTNVWNKKSSDEYGMNSGYDISLSHYPSNPSNREAKLSTAKVRRKIHYFSYEKSLEGIKGMLNDLSQTNREFDSVLENSKTTVKMYYDTKMNSIQKEEIPESLKIQFQTEDAKGRAALIMKLTKKVLRDAYDY